MRQTSEQFFIDEKTEILERMQKDISNLHIIGLDCSLTSTGFAVVRNGKYIAGAEIGSKYYGAKRLHDISIQIVRKIESYPNPFVIIEDYAYHVNPVQSRSILGLAQLGGALRTVLFMRKISFLPVSPTALKKYVHKGHFKKAMMPLFVNKKFGILAIGPDHADAVGLAYFGFHALRFANKGSSDYTVKEIECFETWLSLKPKKKKKKLTTRTLALEINE